MDLAGKPPIAIRDALSVAPRSLAEDTTLLKDFQNIHRETARLVTSTKEQIVRDHLTAKGWEPEAIDRIISATAAQAADLAKWRQIEADAPAEMERLRFRLVSGYEQDRERLVGTQEARRRGHVDQAVDGVSGALNVAYGLVETLAARLGPVLRPAEPAPPSTAASDFPPNPPSSTPLVGQLNEETLKTRSFVGMLRDILERLEV